MPFPFQKADESTAPVRPSFAKKAGKKAFGKKRRAAPAQKRLMQGSASRSFSGGGR